MTFHFYSPVHFEEWDWTAADRGIGGSETHHIEMATRLARRGHVVISYSPMPNGDTRIGPAGVERKPLKAADFSAPGIWVLYRCPNVLDAWEKRDDQRLWMVMQDEGYSWTDAAQEKVDVCFAFCASHEAATLKRYPGLAHALTRTSNGLKMDLIRRVEAEGLPDRNPHRVMYASSPDRGLKTLLELWPRVREHVPDAELHAFYGFNNIDKLLDQDQPWARRFRQEKADIERLMAQPGVTWHGRVPQSQLYREWLKTAVWWYPTQFTETSCITCMEAQALGAVPVTTPVWALRDNVQHGVMVEGEIYRDPLTRARHVAEVVRLLSLPQMQDAIRPQMMQGARQRFNWERYVDQFEAMADGRKGFQFVQFAFQHKHAQGRIINVGCDTDPSDFAARGAINADINRVSPGSGKPNPIHVQVDARSLGIAAEFDTVVLGDILEHMGDADIVRCLSGARMALRAGGRVVLTVPDDPRPADTQHTMGMAPPPEYTKGSSCYHLRRLPTAHVVSLVREAGLTPVVVQEIDYTHFLGTGIVAEAA